MKKIITLLFLAFTPVVFAQGPGCPNVDAGPPQTIDCSTAACVDLTATYLETGDTSSYAVSAIPFNPPSNFNGLANPIFVGQDDIWSSVINLPFDFCFFGDVYSQLVLGANGLISFDTSLAGGFNAWSFSDTLPSSTDDPLSNGNIFGACHDIYPPVSPAGAEIGWEVKGTAPCRTFVISYFSQAQFSCTNLLTSQMIVLYEGTNTIEVYILDKPVCNGWNSGNAVIGIQNNAGTVAYVPPGRNTGSWQTQIEAWRFTPNGIPNYELTWYDSANNNLGNSDTINVCPTADETYTAEVVYTNCNGDLIVDSDTVTVTVNAGSAPVVNLSSNGNTCSGGDAVFTMTGTAGDIVDYNINGGATQQVTLDATGTAVITVTGATVDQTITLESASNPSSGCSGPLTDTETVTISATPTVTLSSNGSTCSGGDAVFTITGTAGDVVDYTINGGATQQVTLDATGTGVVTQTGVTVGQTITLQFVNNPTTGCSGPLTDTDTVTISATPAVTLASNGSTCSGDDAVFTISGSPGDVVDYNINGGATQQVTLDATGNAVVTITGVAVDQTITLESVNNPTTGCSGTLTDTDTVVIIANPTVGLSSNGSTCSGGDAVFTITGAAGDIVDYNINGGATQQVTLDATGTGVVTVAGATTDQTITLELVANPTTTCDSALTDTETVTITATPTVTLTSNGSTCSGGDAVFTITGTPGDIVDYAINGGATQQVTLDATGTGVITQAGVTVDQTITLQFINNPTTGCNGSLTDTDTVTISATPTVTLTSNGSTCSGDDAVFTITGTPGDIVDYNVNGGATQQATLDAAGTVVVTVVGVTVDQTITLESVNNPTTGCNGTLTDTDTVVIIANPTVGLSSNGIVCSGDDAVFTITGTAGDIVDYNINGGATQQVTLDATGTGVVTVTGATTDQTIALELVANPTTTCDSALTDTETVTIIAIPTVTLSSNGSGCPGEDAVFTITGIAGNEVDYNINGGATQQVVLDATGTAVVTVAGVTVDQTMTLELVNNPTTGCNGSLTDTDIYTVNPLPTIVTPTPLIVCDDNIPDGMTEMDLTTKDNEITVNNANYNVTYYNTLAAAQLGTPEVLPSSTAYIGTDGEIIHVRVEDATTGCVDFTTLTLNVVSAPAANTPNDLHYCDPDNDGLGVFDLSNVAAEVTTDPTLDVSFHLTYQNAIDDVLPQGTLLSNVIGQIIYIRVDYAGTSTDCPTIVELQLIVDPTPIIEENLDPIVLCDDDGTADGLTEFDLTIRDADVLNGLNPADYTVTYYELPADADIGPTATTYIATPSAYTNTTPDMQTIGVRVENNITNCYTATTLDLIVNPLPVPEITNDALFLTICDDTVDNDGFAIFDLTVQDDDITGGNTNWFVSYYETMADVPNNPIPDFTAYANASIGGFPHNPQTLIVQVTNGTTGCSALSTLTLQVLNVPTPTPTANITPLEECDEDNDGYATFDLQSATAEIDHGEGNDITYHGTSDNAIDGVNELPDFYTNNDEDIDVVYVRSTNPTTGCFTVVELTLIVLPTPEIALNIDPYSECDDDYDGITAFDLTTMDATIYGTQNPADYTLTYHESLADAEAVPGVNPIVEPQLSNYVSANTTIYVRLEGTNGCIATGQFDLIVNLPPTIASEDGLFEICDDSVDNDGFAIFDLTTQDTIITGNDPTLNVDYFETMADIPNNPIPDYTAYTNTSIGGLPHNPQTIFVTVTETTSGDSCYAVTTLTLVVNTVPTPNDMLPDLEACDDNNPGDLQEVFDITVNEAAMLNAFNETVTYHTTMADAELGDNPITTPGAYQSESRTIYVRVTNTGDPADPTDNGTGCYTIVTFDLIVNPLPATVAVEDIVACELNTDGFYTFDLTIRTTAILNGQPEPDFQVTYYETQAAAESGTGGIANPSAYTNMDDPGNPGVPVNPQEIFVNITNTITGCDVAAVSFFIEVQEGAIANPVATFEVCDDNMEFDGDPTNDTVAFDLTSQNNFVLGTTQDPADFTVTYYLTENDAIAMVNPLTSPYTNVENPQTIWVRVDNDTTADSICYDYTSLELLVNPIPAFILEDSYTLCVNTNGTEIVGSPTIDTGLSTANYTFEWTDGNGTVVGTDSSYMPTDGGTYSVLVTDINTLCTSTASTTVEVSSPPVVDAVVTTQAFDDNAVIEATASGSGNSFYEFSIDDGPWVSNDPNNNSYTFTNVSIGEHTITARDINGCGLASDVVLVMDYPLFFTPNNDGDNDTWQISGISNQPDAKIYIFDRYGKLLKQLSPTSAGWDGTLNGQPLPSSDYWFTVDYREPSNDVKKQFQAHFSLKR